MEFRPSFISLPRLLLGAVLVTLGFLLASSTQARADDVGLVKTVDAAVDTATDISPAPDSSSTPIAKIVEEPTKVVTEVSKPVEATITKQVAEVEAVVEPVTKPVVRPVKKVVAETTSTTRQVASAVEPVVKPVVRPVAKVVTETTSTTRQVASAVKTTTTVIAKTTTAVVRVVEPLVPVSKVVAEPVVDTVETVVPVPDSAPEAELPPLGEGAVDEGAVGVVGNVARADTVEAVGAVVGVVTPTVVPRLTAAGSAPAVAVSSATSFPVAPFFTAPPTKTFASTSVPRTAPDHPGMPGSTPAALVVGGLPGTGSTGGSGPTGGDVATSPSVLVAPETHSSVVLSRAARPHSGPAQDPGSRPD